MWSVYDDLVQSTQETGKYLSSRIVNLIRLSAELSTRNTCSQIGKMRELRTTVLIIKPEIILITKTWCPSAILDVEITNAEPNTHCIVSTETIKWMEDV